MPNGTATPALDPLVLTSDPIPSDPKGYVVLYAGEGPDRREIGMVFSGPDRDRVVPLLTAAADLLADACAVLDVLEAEGRDTGMGGPLSDLRDTIDKAEGRVG